MEFRTEKQVARDERNAKIIKEYRKIKKCGMHRQAMFRAIGKEVGASEMVVRGVLVANNELDA